MGENRPPGTRAGGRVIVPPARLSRFILRVAAWLPLTFLVWYLAAPILSWPIGIIAETMTRLIASGVVSAVEQQKSFIVFVTSLKPASATAALAATGVITVEINPLLYSFGLPMFAALALATGEPRLLRRLGIGYLALLPLESWGVIADFLKNIAITSGPAIASQAGFNPLQREAIAFAYQFGSLILPTVSPAVVWVLMHRRFLERLAGSARTRAPSGR